LSRAQRLARYAACFENPLRTRAGIRGDGGFENPQWHPGLVVEVERKYAPKVRM